MCRGPGVHTQYHKNQTPCKEHKKPKVQTTHELGILEKSCSMVFRSGNKSPGSLGNRAFQLYTRFMCLVWLHVCLCLCVSMWRPEFHISYLGLWLPILKLSAGLQCTAPHPASTHVLESDLGSSCLYTSALLLYLCFTLKCYFYCAEKKCVCYVLGGDQKMTLGLLSFLRPLGVELRSAGFSSSLAH